MSIWVAAIKMRTCIVISSGSYVIFGIYPGGIIVLMHTYVLLFWYLFLCGEGSNTRCGMVGM